MKQNHELKRFKVGDKIVKKSICFPHKHKFYEIIRESEEDFIMIELEAEFDYCDIDNDKGYAYLDKLYFSLSEPIKMNKSILNKDMNYDLHHESEAYQFFCDFNHFQEFFYF